MARWLNMTQNMNEKMNCIKTRKKPGTGIHVGSIGVQYLGLYMDMLFIYKSFLVKQNAILCP